MNTINAEEITDAEFEAAMAPASNTGMRQPSAQLLVLRLLANEPPRPVRISHEGLGCGRTPSGARWCSFNQLVNGPEFRGMFDWKHEGRDGSPLIVKRREANSD